MFGCAVERKYAESCGQDPYERAYEDLVSRFDLFLSRENKIAVNDGRVEQRGLIVLAESSYQKSLTILGRRIRD
jgi:hypothetical protein